MSSRFAFDEFELDAAKLELCRAGEPMRADALVLRLLEVFVRNPGQLITKQELVAQVWEGRAVSENVLTVAMTRLRKTLGNRRRELLVTVHGRGYRFVRPVIEREGAALRPAAALQQSAPFVGREQLMRELNAALHDALSGSGRMLALCGEPGIGKTRAAEVLSREAAAAGWHVAWGYCRELGDTPALWPLVQLLRELLGTLPEAVRADPLLTQLGRLLPGLSERPGGASPPHDWRKPLDAGARHRVFDSVARVLSRAGEHAPCVCILDDLHRADIATLDLLHYVLVELPRTRVLLLATLRGVNDAPESMRAPLLRVLGHRNCARSELPRLQEGEVAHYLGALLGRSEPSWARAVFVKSEGNPFFMTELTRQLRDRPSGDLDTLAPPQAALELVRQRVASLDELARGALTIAAVLGRRFGLSALQAITGETATSLMRKLDAALESEVIAPVPDTRSEFVFTHDLLRAALYEALAPEARRHLHLRVARALERRAHAGEPLPAADMAYHFRSALPHGDKRKTVQCCMDAAREAARVYAYADAARHLQHAREALDLLEDGSPRLRIELLLAQALCLRTHSAKASELVLHQVIALAREWQAGVPLARAALLLNVHPGFPPLAGAREALHDALQLLPPDASDLRACVLARLTQHPPLAYHAARSRKQLQAASELAWGSSDLVTRYTLLSTRLHAYGGPAEPARVAGALSELQQLCGKHRARLSVPPVLLDMHRALAALQAGDPARCAGVLERCENRCRAMNGDLLWHVERFRALLSIDQGQGAQARSALEQLHQRARSQGIAGSELFCVYDECVVLEQLPAATSRAASALAFDPDDAPNLWSLKLRALAAAGLHDEARAALHSVPARALADLPCDREYLGTLGALARAALALGELDYAQALYALLEPYAGHFAVHIAFHCEGSVEGLLGMLAAALGRHAQARSLLSAAIEHAERAGLLACAAEARLALALSSEPGGGTRAS